MHSTNRHSMNSNPSRVRVMSDYDTNNVCSFGVIARGLSDRLFLYAVLFDLPDFDFGS
jgi:hypothetical protein